jgi:hypothetical protein
MAIAYDAIGLGSIATDDPSWTHTPVGTPAGIVVLIGQTFDNDLVTGVTYGGVAMTRYTGGFIIDTVGEACGVYAYYLTSGIPAGAQTVQVTDTGATNKRGVSISVTAATTVSAHATIASAAENQANPSLTISDLPARSAMVFGTLMSGADAVTAGAPSAGTELDELDYGTKTGYTLRSNAESDGSITVGWTIASDDVAAIAVALVEDAAVTVKKLAALGVG